MPQMHDNIHHQLAKMIDRAKSENCWFFFYPSRIWYTPEEFKVQAEADIIVYGEKPDLFVNYQISDPREGIRRRLAHVKKASVDLQEFTEKVMAYYNFTSKNLK